MRPWLLLNGGVRYDQYENFGRATPRGAVIVSPRSGTSLKYLYGEAFRAPNAYELHYFGTTPSDLQPEFVRTHEVVWEQYVGEWLRTSVSAYHYAASQLITFHALESDTLQGQFGFVNDGVIHANGLELEAEARTKRGLQAVMSYVQQDAKEAGAGTPLTNSPQHLVKVRSPSRSGRVRSHRLNGSSRANGSRSRETPWGSICGSWRRGGRSPGRLR